MQSLDEYKQELAEERAKSLEAWMHEHLHPALAGANIPPHIVSVKLAVVVRYNDGCTAKIEAEAELELDG